MGVISSDNEVKSQEVVVVTIISDSSVGTPKISFCGQGHGFKTQVDGITILAFNSIQQNLSHDRQKDR